MLSIGVDIDKNKLKRADAAAALLYFRKAFEISDDEKLADLEDGAEHRRTRQIVISFIIATLLAARWYDKSMQRSFALRWTFAALSFALMVGLPAALWRYGGFDHSGAPITGVAALLTGVLAIQRFMALWLDNHRQYGNFWRARAGLRDLLYTLETKWAGTATVKSESSTLAIFDPCFVADLVTCTAQARSIVRKEQQEFFDSYSVPTPDNLSGLGGAQRALGQLSTNLHSSYTAVAAEAATPPTEEPSSVKSLFVLCASTSRFSIRASKTLGHPGIALAKSVASSCEGDLDRLLACFPGVPSPSHVDLVIVDGAAPGAVHWACSGTDLMLTLTHDCMRVDLVREMITAELVEVLASHVGADVWHCQRSSGEGLSRSLACWLHPVLLPPNLLSAQVWLNNGRPDRITREAGIPTDGNRVAVGCAVLFLNWLSSGLGFSWQAITRCTGSSLSDVYDGLTGTEGEAFQNFRSAIDQKFRPGIAVMLTDENPFAQGPSIA